MNNFATANNRTAARSVGRVELGTPRLGPLRQRNAGWARRCTAGRAKASQARPRASEPGGAWPWLARQRRQRWVRLVASAQGTVWRRRSGKARRGQAFCGNAGLSRLGAAWQCAARQRRQGKARLGEVRTGLATHDTNRGARPGYKLRSLFADNNQPNTQP